MRGNVVQAGGNPKLLAFQSFTGIVKQSLVLTSAGGSYGVDGKTLLRPSVPEQNFVVTSDFYGKLGIVTEVYSNYPTVVGTHELSINGIVLLTFYAPTGGSGTVSSWETAERLVKAGDTIRFKAKAGAYPYDTSINWGDNQFAIDNRGSSKSKSGAYTARLTVEGISFDIVNNRVVPKTIIASDLITAV